MKLIITTAAATLLSGIANAQGLFDINPNESSSESSPLRYTLGLNFGYDDNVNPTTTGAEDSSSYLGVNLSANKVVRNERTSWDVNAMVGTTFNFDDVVANDTNYNARFALNYNHRVTERLRYVSRNFFNFGLDLGTIYGPATARDEEEYTFFSTDNSIGLQWTDRLGTYTGIGYSFVNYDDNARDVHSYSLYNNFRFSLDQKTVLTASTSYSYTDFDDGDTDRITATVGFERTLTDVSSIGASVGAQFGETTTPYASFNYNHQVSSQLRARAFATYSQEDTDTVFNPGRYEDKVSLRIGAAADYSVSPQVTLTFGASTTMSDYAEGTGGLLNGDWDSYSLYTGVSYSIRPSLSMNARFNHTTSDAASSIPNREYSRNNYQIGLTYTF